MKLGKIVAGVAVAGILVAFATGCGKKETPAEKQAGSLLESAKQDSQALAKTAEEKAKEAQAAAAKTSAEKTKEAEKTVQNITK